MFFNLLVIAESQMYFPVCHGTPTNKNLEITNCLQENQIFRYYTLKNKQLLQVPSLLTTTFTTVNLMLLRSKPYDHILQLSTLTCCHKNKLQRYSEDFPSLSSTNSDFELTLTLIINADLLSVPRTRSDSNLSEQ